MNTADYLLELGADSDPALIALGATHTYGELRAAVAGLLHRFMREGVCPGERVGLLGANSPFWVAAYLAALKMGAVAVLLPTAATAAEIARNVRATSCAALCVEQRFHRRFAAAFPPGIPIIDEDSLAVTRPGSWSAESLPVRPDQDAALLLTSGTTCRPRAVRITHRNIQANTESIIAYLELEREDRMMAVLPFYYCFGTSLLHTHLRVGGSLVLNNTFSYPETVIREMAATGCTGFAGVPSTYQTLLRQSSFTRQPPPTLRKLQQAGGKLPAILIRELVKAVPHARVYVMYGQTEATARLSYLPPELLAAKLGSIGRGIPGVQLRVVAESGEDVKPGEVGEIIARGDNISPGYLDDPEESRQKFVDGALRTGDLATVDEQGFIYIVDRKSDFIKPCGFRVSSQEIEACVMELPEAVAAAAVGVPDLVQGEAIHLFMVLRRDATLTATDILAHCRSHLASHKVPQEVVIVSRLPMNSQGKVLKSELRKQAAAGLAVASGCR